MREHFSCMCKRANKSSGGFSLRNSHGKWIFAPQNSRKNARASVALIAAILMVSGAVRGQAFTGMDRNDYPGDGLLGVLRKSFSYTSYWLNAPPGEKTTTWTGKRAVLKESG